MSRILCIYHDTCADGFTAAWAVRQALGESVEFVAGQYGRPAPDVAGRDVVIVDFSYKRPVLDAMAAAARTQLILDHHKSAAEDLAHLPAPPYRTGYSIDGMLQRAEELGAPPAFALFDMDRSGAGLAWDYLHCGCRRPALIDYVEDRDLWRFRLPYSREVNANIFSHGYDFDTWSRIAALLDDEVEHFAFAEAGAAIERKHHKDIAELLRGTKRRMVIGGVDVPVANLPYTYSSDAAGVMAEGEPFAACYVDTATGRSFSLRSTAGGLDVSAIAARYGGGGHARASGFRAALGWEGDAG